MKIEACTYFPNGMFNEAHKEILTALREFIGSGTMNAILVEAVGKMAEKMGLDFSLDSLKQIDDLLESVRRKKKKKPPTEDLLCLGHYVGEVLIRHTGGRWIRDEVNGGKLALEIPDLGIVNPMGKCVKRLHNRAKDGIETYCRIVIAMQKQLRQAKAETTSPVESV